MTTAASTPWGRAELIEQAAVVQRVGGRRFSSVVQLLELQSGERLVRVAYTSDGRGRRGPVTVRLRDLQRLRDELARCEELRRALVGG